MKSKDKVKAIELIRNVIRQIDNVTITHSNDTELVTKCNGVTDILEIKCEEITKQLSHDE